jgi:hypothetical protein
MFCIHIKVGLASVHAGCSCFNPSVAGGARHAVQVSCMMAECRGLCRPTASAPYSTAARDRCAAMPLCPAALPTLFRSGCARYDLTPPACAACTGADIKQCAVCTPQALDAAQVFDFESKAAAKLRSSKALRIGIVGFGNFGQFLAKRMVQQGHTVRCIRLGHLYVGRI